MEWGKDGKERKKGGERCWVVVEMKIKGCWLRYCRWCRLLGLVWDSFSRAGSEPDKERMEVVSGLI